MMSTYFETIQRHSKIGSNLAKINTKTSKTLFGTACTMYLQLSTKEQQKEFLAKYGANEESVKNDVSHLKEWLKKQPHLPNIEDEQYLANFLYHCKNSLAVTKEKLELFYSARAAMSDIFSNYDPCSSNFAKIVATHMFIHLPKLTPEGYRISVYRIFGSQNKQMFSSVEEALKTIQMNADITMKTDFVKSVIYIFDLEHVDRAIFNFYIAAFRKLTTIMKKTLPMRVHKIYILNMKSSFEWLIESSKSLMKKAVADRIEVWNKSPTDLVHVLPKNVLPSNYGGTERSLEELKDGWHEYLKLHREWFLSLENAKADLSKLPKGSKISEEIAELGFNGSFRKISFE